MPMNCAATDFRAPQFARLLRFQVPRRCGRRAAPQLARGNVRAVRKHGQIVKPGAVFHHRAGTE